MMTRLKAMEVIEMSVPKIIAYVHDRYIEPARRRGEKQVVIRAGDIHDEMRLRNRQPLVCATLKGKKLLKQCNVRLVDERPGPNVYQEHTRNIWYTYELLLGGSAELGEKGAWTVKGEKDMSGPHKEMSHEAFLELSTTKDWEKKEQSIREQLSKEFNINLERRKLLIGHKSDGTPREHEFDLVSPDGKIVGEVKTFKPLKGGGRPSGKIDTSFQACYLLEKVKAQRKLLVLTNKEFFELFKKECDGIVSKDIEILYIPAERVRRGKILWKKTK